MMPWKTTFPILIATTVVAQTPAPKPVAVPKPKPAVVAPKPVAAPKAVAAPKVAAAKPGSPAQPAEPPVLTVNGEKIGKTEFTNILGALPEQVRAQFPTPNTQRKLAQDIAELKAIEQEARRLGLDRDPVVAQKIRLEVGKVLANAFLEKNLNLRDFYDQNKARFVEVKGRHILIRFQGSRVPLRPDQKDLTDAEALAKTQDIRKRITGGEDFAEVAKKESDDTGSGAQGGDLGFFGRGRMVKEFEEAAFSLPIGQVSEPVRSQFGYHLIQVQEHKSQSFEEAKATIGPQRAKQVQEEVKQKAKIVLDEGYFGKE